MTEDKHVNLRIQLPGYLTDEQVYDLLDGIKSLAEKQIPVDPFEGHIVLDADWEDEDGTNYWNP